MQGSDKLIQRISYYKIIKQIGKGSFGSIYLAHSEQNNQQNNNSEQPLLQKKVNNLLPKRQSYAIKISQQTVMNLKPMLDIQYQILFELYKLFAQSIGQSFKYPIVYEYGGYQTFSYLVMEQLKSTLDERIKYINRQLSQVTILNLMITSLKSIQQLHEIGYIHRDIKPNNFMIRQNIHEELVLIDFGLCKKYLKGQKHIPMKEGKKMIGTPIYCSLNTHLGYEQSRRDDLQSWFYSFLHFLIILPWQIYANEKDREIQYMKIKQCKISFNLKDIKQKYPNSFVQIYKYIRQLQFLQEPNYIYLASMLEQNIKKLGGKVTNYIDWNPTLTERNSPTKDKVKVNFSLKNRNIKQINKISVENIDKVDLFDKLVGKESKQ